VANIISDPPGSRWQRRNTVVVDLDAIAHNLRRLSPPDVPVMAMVKGNAYGHGALAVAEAVLAAGADWLGVALAQEALALRAAGCTAPIFVSTELPAGSEADALLAALSPSVYTKGGARRLGAAAADLGIAARVHLAVDTGLGRSGVPAEHAVAFADHAVAAGLRVTGVWTHLATAEDRDDFTATQLARFQSVVAQLRARGYRPGLRHAANTAAILAWPQSHLDLVRPGIGLFGAVPNADQLPGASALRPALSWRSRVVQTVRLGARQGISYGHTYHTERPSTVATVSVGFADGCPRPLSNRGQVLIRGVRYPIVGVIAMDQLTVDCGDDPVEPGDEVVLIGEQGTETITVSDVAAWAGTIPDEIFCGISPRVPRDYVGEAHQVRLPA
jgi:alanine racemase